MLNIRIRRTIFQFGLTLLLFIALQATAEAQGYNQINSDGTMTSPGNQNRSDSIKSDGKVIPRGFKVWTIDERFGDRTQEEPDTLQHMFMNTIFTTGLRGEYNTLGNLGSPRINRIFVDRTEANHFIFATPYDFFLKPIGEFKFTNTLSPITNVTYASAGDKQTGEDILKALFAVNIGKRVGLGFNFDYLYGRGYYSNQSTSHFNYSMYGSYIGDRYQAHLHMSTKHQKVAENGGITNDSYVTHPENTGQDYAENEIPTVLSENWNRNDNQHIFFNHRYSIGFSKKVPMTKDEIEAKKFALKAEQEHKAEEAKKKAMREAARNGEDFDEEEYEAQLKESQKFKGRPDDAAIAGNAPAEKSQNKSERIEVTSKEMADSLIAAENNAPVDTTWYKDEYVPVTSFIHTATFDNYRRIYQAYQVPTNYYLNDYSAGATLGGDSIYDKTKHWQFKNTVGIALLEGFNKWAKAGIKAFASYDIRHFNLIDSVGNLSPTNEHALNIGGQISKREGSFLHYNVTGEIGMVGDDSGDIYIDADADVNFKFLQDTLQVAAKGFLYRTTPSFYYYHYHSRHAWWDHEDLEKTTNLRIEGLLTYPKTRTTLRVAMDELKNYTYLGHAYDLVENEGDYLRENNVISVRQASEAISILTLQLKQDFKLGPLNLENEITYQHSSNENIISVPALNLYSNLYFNFKIAKVLQCHVGADVRYFTNYYAPDYSPLMGQFTVQETENSLVKVGNYPIVNAYANFKLKQARFFVMMSHVNYGSRGQYFFTPHYPLNTRIFRFGVSWTFFN